MSLLLALTGGTPPIAYLLTCAVGAYSYAGNDATFEYVHPSGEGVGTIIRLRSFTGSYRCQ